MDLWGRLEHVVTQTLSNTYLQNATSSHDDSYAANHYLDSIIDIYENRLVAMRHRLNDLRRSQFGTDDHHYQARQDPFCARSDTRVAVLTHTHHISFLSHFLLGIFSATSTAERRKRTQYVVAPKNPP